MVVQRPLLARGMSVFTRDHQRLGAIEEIGGGCMKISPRLGRDYWLSTAAILAVDRDAVLVDFLRRDLPRVKLNEPPTMLVAC